MGTLLAFDEVSYPRVTFNRAPIRVALLDGQPWWDTAAIFSLLGEVVDEDRLGTFAAAEMGWHLFADSDEPLHVLTTWGALTLAYRLPWRRYEMVSGWLRKRHMALIAPPDGEPPRVPLRLLADGSMPPRPALSEELASAEWEALEAQRRGPQPTPAERAERQRQLLAEAEEQRQQALAIMAARSNAA